MIAATLCWSTGGILVRSVSITNAWEIVFWRSLFMAVFIALFLAVRYRSRAVARITQVGLPGVLAGVLLASASFLFILAVMRTTVANALVLSSISPFVAALFGRVFLGESVPRQTYVAMLVGLIGIALMFADALGSGNMLGNVLACLVPVVFAANVILLRRMGAAIDTVPTVLLAGLFAPPVAYLIGGPLLASWHDIGILAVMGIFQLGLGCLLMTRAIPHLSAAEVGLVSLLEIALGPIWVWIGIGERPNEIAIVGGLIVITALLTNQIVHLRRVVPTAVSET